MTDITLAVDAMSGDHGVRVIVPAAVKMLKKNPNLHIILVGHERILNQRLRAHRVSDHPRIEIQHASEVVTMDEQPSVALRTKKDSSLRVAVNLVKEGRAQACVSAGNTGALMATAKFVLKMLPGIDRPAILTALPTMQEDRLVRMLDLGANVDSSAERLFQFAVMGSVVAERVGNIDKPKVALLNNGQEAIKGNELVRETAQLLEACPHLNFDGYVEGTDIYRGNVDVIVCDGFVGNVALKASEGSAKLIAFYMKEEFTRNLFNKCIGLITMPIFRQLRKRMDPGRYNGATFVGVKGIVIKSHGGANELGFASAIREAMIQVERDIPQQIRNKVAALLEARDKQ